MKIIFLGTSAGVPTKERNHTSILLIYNGDYLLFDCGEGTQRQLKKAGISPLLINRIFITHLHADHILGLFGLLQTFVLNKINKKIEIYGPTGLKNFLKYAIKLFPAINYLKINITEISAAKKKFEFDNYYIYALKLKHSVTTYGYCFIEKDKLNVKKKYVKMLGGPSPMFKRLKEGKSVIIKGKKITPSEALKIKKGKKISIILDTSFYKPISSFISNSNLLIIECVYSSDLRNLAKEYLHLSTTDVIKIVKNSKVKNIIVTHISERYSGKENEILKELKKELKNVSIARDLLCLEI